LSLGRIASREVNDGAKEEEGRVQRRQQGSVLPDDSEVSLLPPRLIPGIPDAPEIHAVL